MFIEKIRIAQGIEGVHREAEFPREKPRRGEILGLKWYYIRLDNRLIILPITKNDEFVKSLLGRHPGESRGPEHLEITGFRLSPE